mmetsp:Transcript_27286/g.66377  ORF Transcript_27286/g.66377 Transcript_27286/m.66377 type:complete len:192 (-) Transcript_27286:333-908(-)
MGVCLRASGTLQQKEFVLSLALSTCQEEIHLTEYEPKHFSAAGKLHRYPLRLFSQFFLAHRMQFEPIHIATPGHRQIHPDSDHQFSPHFPPFQKRWEDKFENWFVENWWVNMNTIALGFVQHKFSRDYFAERIGHGMRHCNSCKNIEWMLPFDFGDEETTILLHVILCCNMGPDIFDILDVGAPHISSEYP